jgi:chloramphenicol-sensitive protein RarD
MQLKSGESFKGGLAAILAFFIWGLIPIYWKLLDQVSHYELLMQRIVWSFVFLILMLKTRGRLGIFLQTYRNKAMVRIHAIGGILLALNWFAFIYAVTHGQILQASLAYFIVPLVNSAVGFLVLKEPMSKLRMVAVMLATLGVLNEIFKVTEVPWMALTMAASFGAYTLIKKKTSLGTMTGLAVENTIIFPLSAMGLLVMSFMGEGAMLTDPLPLRGLIILTGLVTSIPLLLFSYGAARIQLNTLGFIQFIGPMMKFFIAVWMFHEPISGGKIVTFGFIWAGIACYIWDSLRGTRIKDVSPDL